MNQIFLAAVQTFILGATLAFTAYQTWKLRRSIDVNNYQSALLYLKELREMRVKDPTLARVYGADMGEMTDDEIRHHFFNLMVLGAYEMLYIQYKKPSAARTGWSTWKKSIQMLAREKSFQQMWEREGAYVIMNPDFRKELEKELRNRA